MVREAGRRRGRGDVNGAETPRLAVLGASRPITLAYGFVSGSDPSPANNCRCRYMKTKGKSEGSHTNSKLLGHLVLTSLGLHRRRERPILLMDGPSCLLRQVN